MGISGMRQALVPKRLDVGKHRVLKSLDQFFEQCVRQAVIPLSRIRFDATDPIKMLVLTLGVVPRFQSVRFHPHEYSFGSVAREQGLSKTGQHRIISEYLKTVTPNPKRHR